MIVGPIRPRPSELAIGGASARAISSQKMDCCISEALRPPNSLGQETAAQPASQSLRCQARRYGYDSSSGLFCHAGQSFGAFAASQERNSSRKSFSSAVKFKSIQNSLSESEFGSSGQAGLPDSLAVLKSARSVSCPCQYFLRKSFFRILPVPVLGRLSTKSTARGHL